MCGMETKNSHGGAGRGQGRKPISPDGEVMKERKFRATDAQWEKCQALGGAAWIRDRIDEAADPRETTEPPKRRR